MNNKNCKCGSERLATIQAQCKDSFFATQWNGKETQGYVDENFGIGVGDNVEFSYCLDCGLIQNWTPLIDTRTNLSNPLGLPKVYWVLNI